MIPISKFFTFMTTRDKWLMSVGTVSAAVAGIIIPLISIALSAVTNTFGPANTKEEVLEQMRLISLYICLVGLAGWVFGYLYYAFWQHLAQNLSFDLRSRYLSAVLRQEVAYFERDNHVERLPSQIGENFFVVTESLGEKYSNVIFTAFTLMAAVVIAFTQGADFAGICSAFVPILMAAMAVFGAQVKKATLAKMAVTKQLGGVVEESLSAIKLIASFANEHKEVAKFTRLADQTREVAHS